LRCALPAEVIDVLDFSTLQPVKGSFVDPKLREHHSDLLFTVTHRNRSPVLIYFLIEHKSSSERWVALDLLRYTGEIWRDWLKQHAEIKGTKQLPSLIPLVLYHGTDRWTAPVDIADLVASSAILDRYRPSFRYELLDLSKVVDETLPVGVVSKVALLALKYIFRTEMRERITEIVTTLNKWDEEPGRLEYVRTVLDYLITAAHELSAERLQHVVKNNFTEGDDLMPTIAEHWMQQGLQRGLQQGSQQGLHQGESILVERQLRRRFGALPMWAINRLANAESEELAQCADRLLDAPNLEAVFLEDSQDSQRQS
jgi:predicted transposase/invertase (TIGR01784 family)